MPTPKKDQANEVRPVLVRLPADLHRAVKEKAASEDRSMAQTIRYALRQYTNAQTG